MKLLTRKVGKETRVLIITVLCAIPALFVARQFSPEHGFTKLLEVGPIYLPRALHQFQALNPATFQRKGYDGQFYAQVAIDPSLRDPQLANALDVPEYRSRRILMPALAWLIGGGQPATVVTSYALLNLAAWYLLLALVLRFERPQTVQAWLCVAAIMLTTGALASLQRSLTDLPAATLLVAAAVLAGRSRTAFLALSVLTKETYAVCAWFPLVDCRAKTHRPWTGIAQMAVIVSPLLLWLLYVHSRFKSDAYAAADVSWPFEGWIYGLIFLAGHRKIFAVIAALSLLTQLAYLVSLPRVSSTYWRVAMSFAIASCFMGDDPFTSDVSFPRDLLPMTIGFNILLMSESADKFPFWFIGGNIGLTSGLVAIIEKIL